ncbi:MAG TPA: hypothetical protein VMW93_04465 [bacterium]|nr:hypothetical protein [bacterium]
MYFAKTFIVIALASCTAFGVAVDVPSDDVSANLGLLLQAGHYYTYRNIGDQHLDLSRFDVAEAEFRVYGLLFDKVAYDVRSRAFDALREAYIGTTLPGNISPKIGLYFLPFGVEATTEEGYLTCNARTLSSSKIAPGRGYGVRFDYLTERDTWPYKIGVAAGVYNDESSLMAGAGRVYGAPIPGLKNFEIGYSYYYGKELREKYAGYSTVREEFLEEPRAGADVRFAVGGLTVSAEYMQRFYNDYPIASERYGGYEVVYKDTYDRGYFGLIDYYKKLPWRYFQGFQPYVRYERFDAAILKRGDCPEDRYTGGFALHFLGRNLMFRSDYTRVLEDKYPTSNDAIASEFQVMF